MLSLAIGVVHPDHQRVYSHHDVATLAAGAKHQAKLEGGNTLYVSRRRGRAGLEEADTEAMVEAGAASH